MNATNAAETPAANLYSAEARAAGPNAAEMARLNSIALPGFDASGREVRNVRKAGK